MARFATRLSPLLLAVALWGCDNGTNAPPPPDSVGGAAGGTAGSQATQQASPGVPDWLKQVVKEKWPGVEEKARGFQPAFDEWKQARASGDMAKMRAAQQKAHDILLAAQNAWSEFYYTSAMNKIDEMKGKTSQELATEYLDPYVHKYEEYVKGQEALEKVSIR